MGRAERNHFVDITATFAQKLQALHAHRSQTSHMENLEQHIRSWSERAAADAVFPASRLAEGFFVAQTG